MARIKGSKDGKVITARFNGQSKSLFPSLKQTHLVVLLSISDNKFCSGEYLTAIIKSAIFNFEFTTFLVADEVYWNNLRSTFMPDEELSLKEEAIKLGLDYFESNLDIFLSPLNINKSDFLLHHEDKSLGEKVKILNEAARGNANFEVVFWNDWISKSKPFQMIKKDMMSMYDHVPVLKKSIDQAASNFANRHNNDGTSFELVHKRSRAYLIEESAAVIWIAAVLGYNFIAYPGEMIKPFKVTKEYFIKEDVVNKVEGAFIYSEAPTLLVNWLEISFQRQHGANEHQVDILPSEKIDNLRTHMEIIKGLTAGVLSLDLDEKLKTKLLVDVLIEYQSRL